MKHLITLLSATVILFFASCDKQELPTPSNTTNTVSNISVTYKVYSVSGHFDVTCTTYTNGVSKVETHTFDRTNASMSFDAPKGSFLSIKAKNCIPAADEITAEIWVNGAIFQSASADAPGSSALAEGTY